MKPLQKDASKNSKIGLLKSEQHIGLDFVWPIFREIDLKRAVGAINYTSYTVPSPVTTTTQKSFGVNAFADGVVSSIMQSKP